MSAQMTVRRIDFGFEPGMDQVFVKDDPVTSFLFLGAWMMLPYLEPYLIRTMRQALPLITDEALKEDLKRFCMQEGEHFKQHAKVNDMLRDLHPDYAAFKGLEAELDAEFKAFSKEKPIEFNLAYAEGFESMTSAVTVAQLEMGMFDRSESPLAALAKWHVMEELEHRSVAFDVYHHVHGSYFYRVKTGLWAQRHYFAWVERFASIMRTAEADLIARYQTPEIIAERTAYNRAFRRRSTPMLLATYMPWYNPAKVKVPAAFAAAQQQFTARATSLA